MSISLKSPRTAHLVGSGIPGSGAASERLRWQDIVGRHVVLEEKIDGSEVSFHFDGDANLIARERASEIDLSRRGGAEKHLDGFKNWLALRADPFLERIEDRYMVYAEWCALAHCIFYDRLSDFLVECDMQDKSTGEFLSTERRLELLAGLGVTHAPILFAGMADAATAPASLVGQSAFCSDEPMKALLATPSHRGEVRICERFDMSGIAEGIYGKIEENGVVLGRFKWIREDFVRRIVDGGRHWKAASPVPNLLSAAILDENWPRQAKTR
jgi:hypothetical protein